MLNAAWHEAHPMPRRPALDERVAWHVAHAKVCGCRPIPATIAAELKRRGAKAAARPRQHAARRR